MSEFPLPKLLAFLEEEKDQVEFMKVAAEVGLNASDVEIGKLLLALQLYKAYYATIPHQIKAVHGAAIDEIRGFRDDFSHLADRVRDESTRIGQWAELIYQNIQAVQPETVAEVLHKRLVEETLASIGGTVQAPASAYDRIDKATAKLNAASIRAEAGIYHWHRISLRRVWVSAFLVCGVPPTALLVLLARFVFLKH